ncbi:hypothetical protein T4B_9569 [Trichinella pseudospiralis]|uniref:Uncharacterized protein n=1 Tax=Trichinella pseudospiralis TaxID=6337 RepID=A0A0V1E892_TRIPS|nr:hypothetical protein T4A_3921 [Trichinella pseudospiralis]KRY98974.1 hypothetical protein T4B_9569 [Trichinella pseudospiralis]
MKPVIGGSAGEKRGENLEENVEKKERIYIKIVPRSWTGRTRITDSQSNTKESNSRMMKKHESASW